MIMKKIQNSFKLQILGLKNKYKSYLNNYNKNNRKNKSNKQRNFIFNN